MPEDPPPLYKPELLEPKKKLTLLQHCYKEPWIPIGCLATVGCLSAGFAGFLQGNQKLMQQGMRGRVVAQGLTVFGMLAGIGYFNKQKQDSPLENTDA
mmetsp:Transcript_48381/g.104847  ORF Transcript_48381/g.104847 Transcript_48381/m.104847 type:complete len:98 (+) Transcript_48381:34-327(+)